MVTSIFKHNFHPCTLPLDPPLTYFWNHARLIQTLAFQRGKEGIQAKFLSQKRRFQAFNFVQYQALLLEPCKRDSRYPGKLHRSLKERLNSIEKISITPVGCHGSHWKNLTAVKTRLINACSRENFTVDNITRNTNACGFYWLDEGYFTSRMRLSNKLNTILTSPDRNTRIS